MHTKTHLQALSQFKQGFEKHEFSSVVTHLDSQEPRFTKSRQANSRRMVTRVQELLTPQVSCVSSRDARHASKNALVLKRFLSISTSEHFRKEPLAQTRLQTNVKEHKNVNYLRILLSKLFLFSTSHI